MTPKEYAELMTRAKDLDSKLRDLEKERRSIAKQLADSAELCAHTRTQEFPWEHDDGYGKQSWHTGLRCRDCSKINRWPYSSEHWYLEGA